MKKRASYIGELSSGYESPTVVEYDPATEEGQIGKAFTEKVTTENIWKNDKHLPMGLGVQGIGVVSYREAAIALRRIASKLTVLAMEEEENSTDDTQEKLARISNNLKKISSDLQTITATENHPAEGRQEPWLETSSPQTGDEEWINIGPGHFNDQRDAIGKPA